MGNRHQNPSNKKVLAIFGNAWCYIAEVTPRPFQPIAGVWLNNNNNPIGSATSFGSTPPAKYSLYTGATGAVQVNNLILNAEWKIRYNWLPQPGCVTRLINEPILPLYDLYNPPPNALNNNGMPYDIDCTDLLGTAGDRSTPQFSLSGSLPSSLVVVADSPLTTTYGDPQSYVYNRTGSAVAIANASSIAGDGVTATFPFPATSSGPLPPDMYGTAIITTNSDQSKSYGGGSGFFSVGGTTSFSEPFGLAAGDLAQMETLCRRSSPGGSLTCTNTNLDSHYPVVSLFSQGQVSWNGNNLAVGTEPTAVVSYGTLGSSSESGPACNGGVGACTTIDKTSTGYALVVNSGSNDISIVNLFVPQVVATVQVGPNPVAAAVNPTGTTAYVVNAGNSTISRVNLSTYTVTSTTQVAQGSSAITLDANGNIWIGGNSYVSKLNPTTMATTATYSVTGNVTSIGVSTGLNQVVVTTVANSTSPTGGTINYNSANSSVNSLNLSSNGTSSALSTTTPAHPYATSSLASHLTQPSQLGSGTLVSANYGNAFVISATPTGFQVSDLTTSASVIAGNTPSAVRSIAVDPDYGYVYLALPDLNEVITVPLPPIPN